MVLLVFLSRCGDTPTLDVGVDVEVPADDKEDTVDAIVVVLVT
jgi:hypothetical protein